MSPTLRPWGRLGWAGLASAALHSAPPRALAVRVGNPRASSSLLPSAVARTRRHPFHFQPSANLFIGVGAEAAGLAVGCVHPNAAAGLAAGRRPPGGRHAGRLATGLRGLPGAGPWRAVPRPRAQEGRRPANGEPTAHEGDAVATPRMPPWSSPHPPARLKVDRSVGLARGGCWTRRGRGRVDGRHV